MQEAYSAVGCEVLRGVLQIVGEGVAWQCRAWSILFGCYNVFGMGGIAQRLECDQNSYSLQSFHCYSHVSVCGDSVQNRYLKMSRSYSNSGLSYIYISSFLVELTC